MIFGILKEGAHRHDKIIELFLFLESPRLAFNIHTVVCELSWLFRDVAGLLRKLSQHNFPWQKLNQLIDSRIEYWTQLSNTVDIPSLGLEILFDIFTDPPLRYFLGNARLYKNKLVQGQKVVKRQSHKNFLEFKVNFVVVHAVIKKHEFVLFMKLLQVHVQPRIKILYQEKRQLRRHLLLTRLHKSVVKEDIDVAFEGKDFEEILRNFEILLER